MKLISMTDFVLEQDKLMRKRLNDPIGFTMKVTDYALFLKQPLELEMFLGEKSIFKDFILDETYKREKRQLPYLTNGKVSVFLHSDFAIRHQFVEDLVGSDLELSSTVYF